MVLESNRDLVLRRLTEALARDRTRHQVSEVTSLGLVQLTRKKLGTGLIEAFSTTCPDCGGRGILLHGDPVDSAATSGRKSEPGGRRGKRGKRGGKSEAEVEDVPSPRCPRIRPASIRCSRRWRRPTAVTNDDEDEADGETTAEEVAEVDSDTIGEAVAATAEEDLDDDSEDDDSDDDESDEDEIDLDDDEDEDEIDDDIEVIDSDDSDDDDRR